MILSSPNRIICCYFKALRQQVNHLSKSHNDLEEKAHVATCIFLAITIIESFLNVFFRILVSEDRFKAHEQRLLRDLSNRKSLNYKIHNWPKDILGKPIDWTSRVGKDFMALKALRNSLMHFTSSHSKLQINTIEIHGLSDTSILDELAPRNAIEALATAEAVIAEILRIRGCPEHELKHGLHLWTGKVPW